MKSNSYKLSPHDVQFHVERAHQMRKEFIVKHLRRGIAALASTIRKIVQLAAYRPKSKGFYSATRMRDA